MKDKEWGSKFQAFDYISKTYGDRIEDFTDLVSSKLSAKAQAKIAEIKGEIKAQAICLAAVRNTLHHSCKVLYLYNRKILNEN